MASHEVFKRAFASGKCYEDQPPRIRSMFTPQEWNKKVKEQCIQRGLPWKDTLACTVSLEQDYCEDLVRSYRGWMRVFPYHMSDYLCRVARLTPFKYYLDMMASALKEERSYDRLPNFTAADVLSVLGIGRNEYIAALNACKARRLLWRVNLNRDSIVREQLPTEPRPVSRLEPWWRVAVVNIGEAEFRELGEEELAHLKTAALPAHALLGDPIRVRDLQPDVLRGLLRKGLAYVEVPVEAGDRFAIPPLEGFVSNKTADAGDAASDPLESLLYSVFVANSERMTVADLAGILGVGLAELQAALGVACRLGFATRVTDAPATAFSAPAASGASNLDLLGDYIASTSGTDADGGDGMTEAGTAVLRQHQSVPLSAGLLGAQRGAGGGGGGGGGGVAVVVDAEATGYLMMGALSPGLKRHSVTLFEGGRVAGEEVMRELVSELWASYAAGQGFEGDMLRLTHYAAALASLLEAVRASAGPGVPLELLRKESLAGLAPLAACKVLHHAYCAVVPICPLPPPVLPLSPYQPGPAYYGPTMEAASPWLQLAIYSAARCGPQSLVFVCGQRVWRLPHPLDRCTHALLSPWEEDCDGGRVRAHGTEGGAVLVEAPFLLHSLNELLSRTAVLVQPLDCGHPDAAPDVVDVPLPLPTARTAGAAAAAGGSDTDGAAASPLLVVRGIRRRGGASVSVSLQPGLVTSLQQLGLAACVGHLRLMRTPAPGHHHDHHHNHRHSHHQGQQQHQHKQHPGGAGAAEAESAGGYGRVPGGPSMPESSGPASRSQPHHGAPTPPVTAASTDAGRGGAASTSDPAAAARRAADDGGGPWWPLSAALGVPLQSLELCKAVCRAAEAAGFLTPDGRQAQLQAQQQLQTHLTKLLHQYSHVAQDGSYGSAVGPVGETSPYGSLDGTAAGSGLGGVKAGAAASGPGGHVGSVLPLPALNLSFDGHSLQPIRLRDCVQGLGCLCQG